MNDDASCGDIFDDAALAQRFPLLFATDRWPWIPADLTFTTAMPPDAQVTSIHLIGFDGDRVVLCRDDRPDVWFLPGGTREPGESIEDAVRREVLEEAGARVVGPVHLLGAHTGRSERDGPYRPHLPYPHVAWAWAWAWMWAEVVVDTVPTNPVDGEQVEDIGLSCSSRHVRSERRSGGASAAAGSGPPRGSRRR